MSYRCGAHGWSHMLKACPSCQPTISSGSTVFIGQPPTLDPPDPGPSDEVKRAAEKSAAEYARRVSGPTEMARAYSELDFLAGAAWQREHDAAEIAKKFSGADVVEQVRKAISAPDEIARLKAEVSTARLKAEVSTARERLGPAGYKILQEVTVLRARVEALTAALDELIWLKDWKDCEGKTPEYLRRQPVAWDRARDALARADRGAG